MVVMSVREIQVNGFGKFYVPGEPEERSRRSEECVREVLDTQIYSYPRDGVEDVRSLVDVGCNVGAFIVWAKKWWPSLRYIVGYDPNISAIAVAWRHNTVGCSLLHAAVTIDPGPLFFEEIDWGGSRTYGQNKGIRVPRVHPRDLPAADVLKVDAEGVEVEVFSHYQHWDGVKVLCFEYHETRFRKALMSIAKEAGLVMRRGNPEVVECDTQTWVRT
jgi:FkbM family methyltransferase